MYSRFRPYRTTGNSSKSSRFAYFFTFLRPGAAAGKMPPHALQQLGKWATIETVPRGAADPARSPKTHKGGRYAGAGTAPHVPRPERGLCYDPRRDF